jgi:23S rRNA pseudouridine1911/1915/1917 synthase
MNDIKILYEDDDILVLDKPAGITVNKSDTTKGDYTVQDWIENNFKFQISNLKLNKESDFYGRAGIVHRIDKETSGILLVAKNLKAFENLQSQFKERKVKKTYAALVHGEVKPDEGEIKVPVGRLPWNRKRFGVLAGGKEAVTKYKVIKRMKGYTLLELNPETGRTHQIRVHLKYVNHPIFADYLYAGRKTSRDDRKVLDRVFLHAQKISFYHPKTGELISFESPLPEELTNVLISLY